MLINSTKDQVLLFTGYYYKSSYMIAAVLLKRAALGVSDFHQVITSIILYHTHNYLPLADIHKVQYCLQILITTNTVCIIRLLIVLWMVLFRLFIVNWTQSTSSITRSVTGRMWGRSGREGPNQGNANNTKKHIFTAVHSEF